MNARHRLIIATLGLAIFTSSIATVEAQFDYVIANGAITITKYLGAGGDVIIPGEIDGVPVTGIGRRAFSGCTSLTKVVIPDTVTIIEGGSGDAVGAFSDCTNLTNVTIGSSVTNIGYCAFNDCTGLTNVIIPNSVTKIGDEVFCGCQALTSVTIPSCVTSIGWAAFGMSGLTSVTVPGRVTVMAGAFISCASLANVTLADGITTIDIQTFWNCTSLASIQIPSSVTRINEGAFQGCCGLTEVYFEGSPPLLSSNLPIPFCDIAHQVTVHYLPGTIGWSDTYANCPTAPWVLPYPNSPPMISSQPVSAGLYVGQSTVLMVAAKGAWPLTCQWRKNSIPLAGQTNAALTLANITLADTGDYTVVVANDFGSVTSAVARVEATLKVSPATLYVSLESTNPVFPYATWTTAATNIQQAVDAARAGDTVLVTNGLYKVGKRYAFVWTTPWYQGDRSDRFSVGLSRVVITNSIRLESVNGPVVTGIEGTPLPDYCGCGNYGIRCAFVTGGAVLSGFTLTNGFGGSEGGGVYCGIDGQVTNCILTGNFADRGGGAFGGALYDCVLTGNRAFAAYAWGGGASDSILYNCILTGNAAAEGGGASGGVLNNCLLADNAASSAGGGAQWSTLNNCTVTGNSASSWGGGIAGDVHLNNCIVYFNRAKRGPNWCSDCGFTVIFTNSCTSPLPANGTGNIDSDPCFVNAATGDLRLGEGSPCIDSGKSLLGLTVTYHVQTGLILPDLLYSNACTIAEATDILGNTRLIDGNGDGNVAWDMGAYEVNSFKPPRFVSPPQMTEAGWRLTITGATNKWVQVERTSNLVDWEPIPPRIFMGELGMGQVSDLNTGGKMFYRAYVPQ